MDVVITYVDGLDPVWQKQYADTIGMENFLAKRFRDWGLLKYLVRGIETYMPFVRNVYLVVSGRTQVPGWVDSTNLHIITHEDIIPKEYLPTFNSTAIEMFLHRIEGLDEEFVYFNDDMMPLMPCTPEDFFINGKTTIPFRKHLIAGGMYMSHTKQSDMLSRKALGIGKSLIFIRPKHMCSPMLRSQNEAVFEKVHNEILASISPLREKKNVNQYIFLDYLYHSGKSIKGQLTNKHFSLASASVSKICKFIENPTRKFACINDVQMDEDKFITTRDALLASFEKRLGNKSRFEL